MPVLDRPMLLSLVCHGVSASVRVSSASMAETVIRRSHEFLPGVQIQPHARSRCSYRIEESDSENGITVFTGAYRLATAASPAEALQHLCSHLQGKVAERADSVFIHAGAVAWKGRALVFPARSYSGKSTLVAELVKRGAEYCSDEYAIFDQDGWVHPFACPMHLRATEIAPRQSLLPDQFAGRTATEPLPLGLLLFLKYRPSAEWAVRQLPPGNAALHLLRNSLSARRNPAGTLRAISQAATAAPAFHGRRGEAARAADNILRLFETHGFRSEPLTGRSLSEESPAQGGIHATASQAR